MFVPALTYIWEGGQTCGNFKRHFLSKLVVLTLGIWLSPPPASERPLGPRMVQTSPTAPRLRRARTPCGLASGDDGAEKSSWGQSVVGTKYKAHDGVPMYHRRDGSHSPILLALNLAPRRLLWPRIWPDAGHPLSPL